MISDVSRSKEVSLGSALESVHFESVSKKGLGDEKVSTLQSIQERNEAYAGNCICTFIAAKIKNILRCIIAPCLDRFKKCFKLDKALPEEPPQPDERVDDEVDNKAPLRELNELINRPGVTKEEVVRGFDALAEEPKRMLEDRVGESFFKEMLRVNPQIMMDAMGLATRILMGENPPDVRTFLFDRAVAEDLILSQPSSDRRAIMEACRDAFDPDSIFRKSLSEGETERRRARIIGCFENYTRFLEAVRDANSEEGLSAIFDVVPPFEQAQILNRFVAGVLLKCFEKEFREGFCEAIVHGRFNRDWEERGCSGYIFRQQRDLLRPGRSFQMGLRAVLEE